MLNVYTPDLNIFGFFFAYFDMKFMVPMVPLNCNMSIFIAGNKRSIPKPSTIYDRIQKIFQRIMGLIQNPRAGLLGPFPIPVIFTLSYFPKFSFKCFQQRRVTVLLPPSIKLFPS